jgi:5-methylcytosine-specific restriction endonuclease McrA
MNNFPLWLQNHPKTHKTFIADAYIENVVLWREQRLKAIERDKFKCAWCGNNKRLVAHHTSYVHKKGTAEELRCLITLCKDCHDGFHKTHYYDRKIGSHRKGKPKRL